MVQGFLTKNVKIFFFNLFYFRKQIGGPDPQTTSYNLKSQTLK